MKKSVASCFAAAVAAVFSFVASAGEVSPADAKAAVRAWMAKYGGMEGASLGALADKKPAAYKNDAGRTLFYVINLEGGGFVIASANTKIAPVVMFTDQGEFDPNPENPMYAILTGDMSDRLEAVDEYEAKKSSSGGRASAGASQTKDEKEWAALLAGKPIDYGKQTPKAGGRASAGAGESTLPFANEPDGLRAPQMIRAIWNQAGNWNGIAIENYYTPGWRACGCVATAYAQIAHYWRWPKHVEPIENRGQEPFYRKCAVEGVETNLWLKGGDYNYDLMPGNRGFITSAEECEA
ncbi:MAG: Spi family protease inhibitor, partial [Kiritimatiellae bacterium]|nr:Spi family protease inhibitor [Kiritimatiellia bacterium]